MTTSEHGRAIWAIRETARARSRAGYAARADELEAAADALEGLPALTAQRDEALARAEDAERDRDEAQRLHHECSVEYLRVAGQWRAIASALGIGDVGDDDPDCWQATRWAVVEVERLRAVADAARVYLTAEERAAWERQREVEYAG